jgi:hypothetical protein
VVLLPPPINRDKQTKPSLQSFFIVTLPFGQSY